MKSMQRIYWPDNQRRSAWLAHFAQGNHHEKLMTQEDWEVCAEAALKVFTLGQQQSIASMNGLISVDTIGRYIQTGEIRLIDEVHYRMLFFFTIDTDKSHPLPSRLYLHRSCTILLVVVLWCFELLTLICQGMLPFWECFNTNTLKRVLSSSALLNRFSALSGVIQAFFKTSYGQKWYTLVSWGILFQNPNRPGQVHCGCLARESGRPPNYPIA